MNCMKNNINVHSENEKVSQYIAKGDELADSAFSGDRYKGVDRIDKIFKKALAEYSLALEIEPENPYALIKHAETNEFIQRGIARGRSNLKKALRIVESNSECNKELLSQIYNLLGESYESEEERKREKKQKWDKVFESYTKAIKLDDKNVKAHVNIGKFYFRQGNKEESEKHFKQVIDLDPNKKWEIDLVKEILLIEEKQKNEAIMKKKIIIYEIETEKNKIYRELLDKYKTDKELQALMNKNISRSGMILIGDFTLKTMIKQAINIDAIQVFLVKDTGKDVFLWVFIVEDGDSSVEIRTYPLKKKLSKKLKLEMQEALINRLQKKEEKRIKKEWKGRNNKLC